MTFNEYQELICNHVTKTYKATVAVENNYITIHIVPYNIFIKFDIHYEYETYITRLKNTDREYIPQYEIEWILENAVDRLIVENIVKGAKNE